MSAAVETRRQGIADLQRVERLRLALVLAGSLLAALGGGLAVGAAPSSGGMAAVAVAALFLIALLFWYSKAAPLVVFVLAATVIDRYGDPTALTARLPFWRSVGSTHIFPIEALLVMALLFWVLRDVAARRFSLPRSQVAAGMGILLLLVLLSWGHGLGGGGDSQIALQEARPWLYLMAGYLLASRLVTKTSTLRGLEWALVIGTGLKGLYGIYRAHQLSGVYPPPDSILEHDESVFFTVFIVLVVALWVFGQKGALRRVATAMLPFVVYTDVANNRRAAWLVLPAALLALSIIVWVRRPERRPLTTFITVTLMLIGGAYTAAFHNNTSSIGSPASAIWSAFQPDARDAASNNYRDLENQNLAIDIKQVPLQGLGLGVRFGTPIPVVDVSRTFDPLIFYIPHNTVLWVWLRLGILGMLAFWWTVGAAVIAASRLAKGEDPRVAVFATVTLAAIISYLGQGWLDQGIASLRIAALVGVMIGSVEAVRALSAARAGEPTPARRRSRQAGPRWQPVLEPALASGAPGQDEPPGPPDLRADLRAPTIPTP